MVSATDRPNVLRVTFYEEDTPQSRTMIVCLVEATDMGKMKITYQHHVQQSRPTGKGNWENKSTFRMHTLAPALAAAFRTNVMYELFSTFCPDSAIDMGAAQSSMGFPIAEPN